MNKTQFVWDGIAWSPIPEYPGYYASRDGKILSCQKKNPRILRQVVSKDGHSYVFLYREQKMSKIWVHRAVLMAWDRLPKGGEECRHLDDNPANNHIENLQWGTRYENVADKRRNDRLPIGERSGTHKLSEQDVRVIRIRCKTESYRSLAREYGVSHTAIRRAALGIKWGHINEESP